MLTHWTNSLAAPFASQSRQSWRCSTYPERYRTLFGNPARKWTAPPLLCSMSLRATMPSMLLTRQSTKTDSRSTCVSFSNVAAILRCDDPIDSIPLVSMHRLHAGRRSYGSVVHLIYCESRRTTGKEESSTRWEWSSHEPSILVSTSRVHSCSEIVLYSSTPWFFSTDRAVWSIRRLCWEPGLVHAPCRERSASVSPVHWLEAKYNGSSSLFLSSL